MKPAKSLLALLAFFGTALSASAVAPQVVIHITGSTAFRQAMNQAIFHSFTGGSNGHTDIAVAANNASFNGAGAIYVRGTMNGKDTVVETSMGGSTGGIYSVTKNIQLSFFADTSDDLGLTNLVYVPVGTNPQTVVTAAATVPSTNKVVPEITFSDTFQSSTPYTTPTLTGATITSNSTSEVVGVVPFVFVKGVTGVSAASNLTNISPSGVQALYGGLGKLGLAAFTGLAADETVSVYGFGRDPDSGTRLTAFAEGGLGSNAFVQQYQPTAASGSGAFTASQTELVPGGFIANLGGSSGPFIATGNNGFSSGGNLATALKRSFTDGVAIGYVGTSDAATVLATSGTAALSWNGVYLAPTPTSTAWNFDLIREGKYTFWGYEHVLYNAATLSADGVTTINKIATQINDTDAAANSQIALGTMHVVRASDGSLITPNF